MQRFFSAILVAVATIALLGRGAVAQDQSCSTFQSIFLYTATLHPCVWDACPVKNQFAKGSCPELLQAFKDAGVQMPCMFDVCPGNTPATTTTTNSPNNGGDDSNTGAEVSQPMVGTYLPNWFVYMKHYMGPTQLDANPQTNIGDPTEGCCLSSLYFAYDMRNVAPYLTHIYYAFFDLTDTCAINDKDAAASWYGGGKTKPTWIKSSPSECYGLMNQLLSLKTEFPHLNIMLSVGGWTYSQNFYKCAADAAKREVMWKSFRFWMDKMDPSWGTPNGKLTGIDFDWEHPATNDGFVDGAYSDNDWVNYAALVKYFRQQANSAGKTSMQMSSALGVGHTLSKLVNEFPNEAKTFCENLDHVNLMTYDLHGKWDPTTGHNAPFCSDSNPSAKPDPTWHWSVVEVVKPIAKICGYAKLNLGLPNYAPAWTGIEDNGVNGLYQTSTQQNDQVKGFARWSTFSDEDKYLKSQGQVHYWDMKDLLQKYPNDFKLYTAYTCEDLGIQVPVQYVYSSTHKAFASFETLDVVKAKVQWAKKIGMGGFFYWDASQDRNGETLAAGVEAWGTITPKNKSGSKQCYDANKPDFSLNPATGKPLLAGCYYTDKKISARSGVGCSEDREDAKKLCPNGVAYAVGGQRNGGSCMMPCSYDWDNSDGPQAYDTIYIVCDPAELDSLTPQ